ncbi:unnamed protein product [Caenorhabditis sp. 36 PRJEB53466]|nr:unnamed protein product [Caenorhabditis sp. 36 PRJEB53466]
MLYATFYSKFQDAASITSTVNPNPVLAPDPFNLDHIGDGYDVWTRGETQLLVLAVILVIMTLLFVAIVALDCGRNSPMILRSGTLRDVVRHGATNRQRSTGGHTNNVSMDEFKAPPLSFLAPPPYVDRRYPTSSIPLPI